MRPVTKLLRNAYHSVAALNECIAQMRPQEAGSPGHYNTHISPQRWILVQTCGPSGLVALAKHMAILGANVR